MWAWVQHSRLSLIFNVLVVVAGLCAGDDHNSKHGVIPALAEFESKYKSQLADFANLRRHYNHSDHFSDIFPLPMTPHMHKRVLKLRNLLRTQDNDLKEVRGNRLARLSTSRRRLSRLFVCFALFHPFFICSGTDAERMKLCDHVVLFVGVVGN